MSKVYVPDIECDSCVRLITKKLKDSSVKGYAVGKDGITLSDSADSQKVISLVNGLGYRAGTEPFERKNLKERFNHLRDKPHLYEHELRALNYFVTTLLVLGGLFLFSYFGFLKYKPGFIVNFGWWMLYLIVSVAALSVGFWHFYSYRARVTCMFGMMIGMGFGMQVGMMIGTIVGATNGFFVGAMVGMILGVVAGVLTGKCCGVMGVLQGMMAGVMGGTMGPMISVMMLTDNLLYFMPIYMLINLIIVAGLAYMVYEEVVEGSEQFAKKPVDFVTLLSSSVIVTFILSYIMIYGPRSALLSLLG